jgi:hypothetical protein
MLHDSYIWLRVGARLARAFGQSYSTLRRAVMSGSSGFSVHTVRTAHGHRHWYLRLDEVNRAIGREYRPDGREDEGEGDDTAG